MDTILTLSEDQRDCYQEITNVAMGQAADRLARLLHVYVALPIPNVNIIEINEFKMTLKSLEGAQSSSLTMPVSVILPACLTIKEN